MIARAIASLALCASSSAALAQNAFEVSPELWDRPRSGASVAAEENVKRAVAAALAEPEARIVIHHSAGQEQALQAEELRSWLGALAIDTRRIALRGDLPAGTHVRIEVMP